MITFQAEDEIAAITSAIGAAYAGALGITSTSGPGMALKTEALGLAVAVELPLVDLRHPARRTFHRPSDENRAGGSCCRRSTAETPKRRFRFSRRRPRAIASGSRSKPAASPSSTWCPSLFFPTATSPTARSRGRFRRSRTCRKFPCTSKRIPKDFSRTAAIRTRSRARGRFPARRDSSTASAASRNRTSPATSTTSR